MKKILAGLFVTADGVVEAPEHWQFPHFNGEVGAILGAQLGECDTLLLGRRTYDDFAGFWPGAGDDVPFASFMNNAPKYVASNTLSEPSWSNTTVLGGDVVTNIAALKAGDGAHIQLTGSATLLGALLGAGLVDELRLLVCPVVRGHGARLFDGVSGGVDLTATAATRLSNGVVHVVYQPAPK